MAPKRKSDAIELDTPAQGSSKQPDDAPKPAAKKARTKKDAAEPATAQTWKDIKLEGEDEDGGVPVYDTCREVRRKIRLLQKTPGWKVTQWLREIGNINNNSYSRFMKESNKLGGAGNGTYYAAYVYFEKVRVLEGKKKTGTRLDNEATHPGGFPLENLRPMWVFGGR
ncbi:hypothetical protein D9619_003147 [Psilocybe cf. subviscida]|uniref:DUF7726 domain-containing protein n=1 Tax=Psilocybe cf. subviscida TaxID=2480587 RepID=A0A8H5AXG5_9AGAR|nr:hypothetical protein D9619_003147 [Psilocybe cf. subviscida]